MVFIYRPARHLPENIQKFKLTNQVGGFFGFGQTSCVTEITFDRNEYYLGEDAKVHFACDNSRCSKAVRGFKMKLHRKYTATDPRTKQKSCFGDYCAIAKFPGCPANKKIKRTLQLRIPISEKSIDLDNVKHVEDERKLLESLTTSVEGKLFKVKYSLLFFVKHDAWNEFGEGNCIKMPVKIWQPPMQQKSAEDIIQPQDWAP